MGGVRRRPMRIALLIAALRASAALPGAPVLLFAMSFSPLRQLHPNVRIRPAIIEMPALEHRTP
jgi:hypothetical protein